MENLTNKLKILTYNAWGLKIGPFSIAKDYKARIYALPSEIYKLNPDIIFLQEVWKKIDRDYLIKELQKRGFKYAFYKSDGHPKIKKWRKNFSWLNRLMLGNGLLIISKHPINMETSKVVSFSGHTAKEEFFTRKGAIFCEIELKGLGPISCVNTHLGSVDYFSKKLKFNPTQKNVQTSQLKELEEFIKRIPTNSPLFIGADLNIDDRTNPLSWFSNPGSEYKELVSKLNLVDSYRFIHPSGPGITYSNKTEYKNDQHGPDARIDYLFHANLGGHLSPIESDLVFNQPINQNNKSFYLSDHFGVLSQYQLKK